MSHAIVPQDVVLFRLDTGSLCIWSHHCGQKPVQGFWWNQLFSRNHQSARSVPDLSLISDRTRKALFGQGCDWKEAMQYMRCVIDPGMHEGSWVFPVVVSNYYCSWSKNRHIVTVSCLTIPLMVFAWNNVFRIWWQVVGTSRVHHPFILMLIRVFTHRGDITGKVSNFTVKVGLVYIAGCVPIWYIGIWNNPTSP